MQGLVEIITVGRFGSFGNFFAAEDPAVGPGWYVKGRRPEFGGNLVMLCARPNVQERKHPHYSCFVRSGWATKAEAQRVADHMNAAIQREATQADASQEHSSSPSP